MLSYAKVIALDAERAAAAWQPVEKVLEVLRRLPLDDFAELLLLNPQPEFPQLGRILPRMASAKVQQQWTGAEGYTLLRQTLSFMRIVSQTYAELYGRPMSGVRALDYGCGYGRILRLMYYYTNPEALFACDPWDEAIAICRNDGILGTIVQSEYLPRQIPFAGHFDLVYAFSVFTHLSLNATQICLRALDQALAPEGLVVVTLRPIEYWDHDLRPGPDGCRRLKDDHNKKGFAYIPHGNIVAGGEAVYGDTSMTFDYLERLVPRLRIARFVRSLDDPYQIIVFLQRR